MAVDRALLEKLEGKLGVGRRQVNNRIAERARTLVLPREQAAIALSLQLGIPVSPRFASAEDLAAIRGAAGRVTESGPFAESAASARVIRKRSAPRAAERRSKKPTGRRVFVVHGRDTKTRRAMFDFLRALDLQPIEWSQAVAATKKGSPYIGEVLDQAFKDAVAVVVLLTPDDDARLRTRLRKTSDPAYEKRLTGQARPNVLFEAGMAFGHLPERTVLVQVGDMRPFSDVAGRHVVKLSNKAEARSDLANRLRTAGCDVKTDGTDWLRAGEFGD